MNTCLFFLLALFCLVLPVGNESLAGTFYHLYQVNGKDCQSGSWSPDCAGDSTPKKKDKKSSPVTQQKPQVIVVQVPSSNLSLPATKPEKKDKSVSVAVAKPKVDQAAQADMGANKDAPKTNGEYIQQQMWKYMPDQYKLTPAESKELGQLSPEARDMPLPALKFFLRPPGESPAQTKHDFQMYKQWAKNNAQAAADFQRTFRILNQESNPSETLKVPDAEERIQAKKAAAFSDGPLIPEKQVALLYFFNSHCPFCSRMTPVVGGFLSSHPNISAYGFDMDEDPKIGDKYLKDHNIPIPSITPTRAVLSRFKIPPGYPRTVLVDLKTGAYVLIRGYPRTDPKASVDVAYSDLSGNRKKQENR